MFYIQTDKQRNIQYPLRFRRDSEDRWEYENEIASRIPPLHEFIIEALASTNEVVQTVLSGAAWWIDDPDVEEYFTTGQLELFISGIPNLAKEIKSLVLNELREYRKELWEGTVNCTPEYSLHQALWAAGHINHSVKEIMRDWEGRPRGQAFRMKSRKLVDLPVIRANYEVKEFKPPYAEVKFFNERVTRTVGIPRLLADDKEMTLLPWSYHDSFLSRDELVYTNKTYASRHLKQYAF